MRDPHFRSPRSAISPALACFALLLFALALGTPVSATLTDDGWTEAEAAYKAGRFAEAIAGFAAGAKADPEEPRWHFMLGLSQLRSKQPTEAVESLSRALSLQAGEPSYALALAQAQVRAGDPQAAFATLEGNRPPAARPELQSGWLGLVAATAGRMQQPKAAIPTLEGAVEMAPERADLRLALGRAYSLGGDSAQAFEQYAAAAADDDRAVRSAIETALDVVSGLSTEQSEARTAWYERAADVAEKAAVADLPPSTLFAAGDVLLLAGRPAEAEVRLRKAAVAEPTSALAKYQIARARLAQDDAEGALSLLTEALALEPEAPLERKALAIQAQALVELERYEEAAAVYRQAGDEARAAKMVEIVAALEHNEGVAAEIARCSQRWAAMAQLREENRDVEGTSAWTEIERREARLKAECGPDLQLLAGG